MSWKKHDINKKNKPGRKKIKFEWWIFPIPKTIFYTLKYCTDNIYLNYTLCITQWCVMIPCVTVVTTIFGNPYWLIFVLKKFRTWKIFADFFLCCTLARFNAGLYLRLICNGANLWVVDCISFYETVLIWSCAFVLCIFWIFWKSNRQISGAAFVLA